MFQGPGGGEGNVCDSEGTATSVFCSCVCVCSRNGTCDHDESCMTCTYTVDWQASSPHAVCAAPRLARERFGSGVDLVPLNLAQKAPRAAVPSAIYIPPPLQDQSWGWYPEWNKMWDGWGMPAYGW